MNKLENESKLCDRQMGFGKKRSQVFALVSLINDSYKTKKRLKESIFVSLDIIKAHNLVWLDALFHKTLNLGFSNGTVKWVEALTTQRFVSLKIRSS